MKKSGFLRMFISCLLAVTMFGPKAIASHTMGADLTYQHLGGNTYKLTLSFYRDCAGITPNSTAIVNISSASCGKSLSLTLTPRVGTGNEIPTVCQNSTTTCNGGTFTGVQEWVFDGTTTLPMQCSDWVFGYSLCCRNAAITTINAPSSSTFYCSATLNNLAVSGNNSPTFTNKPVPFLFLGQNFTFNHGANDPDGDSLAFQLITPRQTAATTVNYIAPFTASNPLTSVPATTFNTQNGDIVMTPLNPEVTVMAVLVKEYRRGVLVGSVERDLQLTVMTGTNNLPTLTGINGTRNFSTTVCPNQPLCFDIYSNDQDSSQQVQISWNGTIPNATFRTTSGMRPGATFCWTPTASDAGRTYSFTSTVKDNACPYTGTQTYSYTIHVNDLKLTALPDVALGCSTQTILNATVSGGNTSCLYLWNNGATTPSITAGPGTWSVQVTDGTCSAFDTIMVGLPSLPTAAFSTTGNTCAGSVFSFIDQSITSNGNIASWNWNFGDGMIASVQNPSHTFASPGSYDVLLTVQTAAGCIDSISRNIQVNGSPVVSFTAGNGCVDAPVSFTNADPGAAATWNWNFGDGSGSTIASVDHTYNRPGNYSVTLTGIGSNGCSSVFSSTVNVSAVPVANAGADRTICSGSGVTLTANGGTSYTWIPGGTASAITVNPVGTTNYILVASNGSGCSSSDTVTVAVNPSPVADAGTDRTICSGSATSLSATGGTTFTWMPGGMTGATISVNPTSTTNYSVVTTNSYGCSATDIITISVAAIPVANAGTDQRICSGSSVNLHATGGTTYRWSQTGETMADISVSPSMTTSYTVIASNSAGCTSSDEVTVTVVPVPAVSLQPRFLCTGSSITLSSNSNGVAYSWSPGGATTSSITVNQGGTYTLTVTDANGCAASASSVVTAGSSMAIHLSDVTFCHKDSILLDAGYPGMSYSWLPGGQTTQSIMISQGGTYSVTVTDPAGCSGSISIQAVETPSPVALWSAPSACQGDTMFFTNMSSVVGNPNASYHWNFGDGGHSTLENPYHVYDRSGSHPVHLTIHSGNGCSAPFNGTVYVNPLPETNFSTQDICAGGVASFTNLTTLSEGNITGYTWNFGDGSTSTAVHPTHSYSTTGTMTVTLVATTAGGCTFSMSRPITVLPNPVAAITAATVCNGTSMTLGNSSGISEGMITSYDWNFGDGSTSSVANPNHQFPAAGTYTVTLIATSALGCSDTATTAATVFSNPIIHAGQDVNICAGGTTTLTASGGNSYLWLPGNQTSATINVRPGATTSYTVMATDTNGCASGDAVTVNVLNPPVARVNGTPAICIGQSATLNGSGGNTYSWSPGGATTSSITLQPAASTDYLLTVTDLNGCTDTQSVHLEVHQLPIVYAGPDQTVCSGTAVTLTATGASNYSWIPVGATSPMLLITPTTPSQYILMGTDVNGCTNSDTIQVAIRAVPNVNMLPTYICQGQSTVLDAGNAGASYQWINGATTQTISVNAAGNYTVLVTTPDGCSALGNVFVSEPNNLQAFPVVDEICSGQSVQLSAGNPGGSYLWSTGATTQNINVSGQGNYAVTITDANGCTATLVHRVNVNPIPTPRFTALPACQGVPVQFNNQSSVAFGTIRETNWNFGNGMYSNLIAPNHSYTSSGTYPVQLTVTSTKGCSATITGNVVIHPLPTADFSVPSTCEQAATTFSDGSTVNSGSIASWNWNFGDNSSASVASPTHTYAAAGTYDATLIVSSNNGCIDSISRTLTVYSGPATDFTATNACTNAAVALNNLTTSSSGSITGYTWNFGDGQTATGGITSHTYAAAGTYDITLTATSIYGCTTSTTRSVNSFPLPTAAFAAQAACPGTPVSIANNSTISSGTINGSTWTFSNNTYSSLQQPSPVFQNAGTYDIMLVATSSNGCADTTTGQVTIHPAPSASFTAPEVCLNTPSVLTSNSSISSGSVTSWSWNLGDSTITNGSTAHHTYAAAGTYVVNLSVTSNNGCTATTTGLVNVFPNPIPAFTTGNVCFGSATTFVNQSMVPGGNNFTSNWNFSNGTTSSDLHPTQTFQSTGLQQAQLTVSSGFGCVASLMQPFTVYALPVAQFSTTNRCENSATQFTDLSTSNDGSIAAWAWNFGDGSAAAGGNPTHNFTTAGSFNVTLDVTSQFGCRNNTAATVVIQPQPTVTINAANGCVNSQIPFTATTSGANGPMQYVWSLGNGTIRQDSGFYYAFVQPGNYPITLTATSTEGCVGSATRLVEIYPEPVAEFSTTAVCQGARTSFTNRSLIHNGIISGFSWNFGDGQTASTLHTNHTYAAAGDYTTTLTATSDHGCNSIITHPVTVHANPSVNFSTGVQGCSPLLFTPTGAAVSADGSVTDWLWDFGDGVISTDQFPTHTYTDPGNHTVSVTVVTNFGCQAHLAQPGFVQVFPGPQADFVMNTSGTNDMNPTVAFSNLSQGYSSFQWNFGDGHTDNTHPDPVHAYAAVGNYTATLVTVNQFGCKDSVRKSIDVRPSSTLYAPNCFTPNGDGKNDVFKPEFTNMSEIEVWVFDRWGLLISNFDGLTAYWDGYFKGNKCQSDTYVYKIKGKGVEGKDYEWVGHVSIVY